MNKTVFKKFFVWEYEKEENWLNEMSKKGWQLINAQLFKYVFEKGEPNEYDYRLELLDNKLGTIKSEEYINFLKDSNIENVGRCCNWIYLRSKKSEGSFNNENKLYNSLIKAIHIDNLYQSTRNIILYFLIFSLLGLFLCQKLDLNINDFLSGFLTGFFTGTTIALSLFSLIIIPITNKNKKKITEYIKDLSVLE